MEITIYLKDMGQDFYCKWENMSMFNVYGTELFDKGRLNK